MRLTVTVTMALMVGTLAGCGAVEETNLPVADGSQPETAGEPLTAAEALRSPPPLTVRPEELRVPAARDVGFGAAARALAPLPSQNVAVSMLSANGLTLHGALGVASCGWWIFDKAQSAVSSGVSTLAFSAEAPMPDSSVTLFLWLDRNGNGVCESEHDSLWQTDLAGTVDIAQAQPLSGWECLLFTDY